MVIRSEAAQTSWFTQDGGQGHCPVSNGTSGRPTASSTLARWAARVGGARRPQAVRGTGRRPPLGTPAFTAPSPFSVPGLAVHQIITITVSLIMVIAALITTLVLKNW